MTSAGRLSPALNGEVDDDNDDSAVDQSLASQARKKWMTKDANLRHSVSSTPQTKDPQGGTRRWSMSHSSSINQNPISPKKNKDRVGTANQSRWGNTSSAISDKNLKQPMSWHGGKAKLSPSKFSAPFSPPLAARQKFNGVVTAPPLSSESRKEADDVSLGSNILRGSKVYRLDRAVKTQEINSFLPKQSSSDGRSWMKRTDVYASAGEDDIRSKLNSSGISMEALPDTSREPRNGEEVLLEPISEADKGQPRDAPFETHYEEEEDEEIDHGEDSESTFGEDQVIELHSVKECVVDRVPKIRWSSRNVENFPIWPPVIRVRNQSRKISSGSVSGISAGSGFTESEFTSDFSTLGEWSHAESIKRRPPEKRTSYCISYGGPTCLNLDSSKMDNRFESTVKTQPDGAPNVPTRSAISDSRPNAPLRTHSSMSEGSFSEDSVEMNSLVEQRSRPDVWITALSGESSDNMLWNVKRSWGVETEDEKEPEHSVHNKELFTKIKSLVGAPESPTKPTDDQESAPTQKDGKPMMPSRNWQMQRVVEQRGRVEAVEPKREMNEEQLNADIGEMAKAAVVEMQENTRAMETLMKKAEQKRTLKFKRNLESAKLPQRRDIEKPVPPLPPEKLKEVLERTTLDADKTSSNTDMNGGQKSTAITPEDTVKDTPEAESEENDEQNKGGEILPLTPPAPPQERVVTPVTRKGKVVSSPPISPKRDRRKGGKKEKKKERKSTVDQAAKSPRRKSRKKQSSDESLSPRNSRRKSRTKQSDDESHSERSPSAKKEKKKKKKSRKSSPNVKKRISAADMLLAASSSSSSSSDTSDDFRASSKSPTKKETPKQDRKLTTPRKISRIRLSEKMITAASMVNSSDSSDSDSSRDGPKSPSRTQKRDSRLPNDSSATVPWWQKKDMSTPKKHHSTSRKSANSANMRRLSLADKKGTK